VFEDEKTKDERSQEPCSEGFARRHQEGTTIAEEGKGRKGGGGTCICARVNNRGKKGRAPDRFKKGVGPKEVRKILVAMRTAGEEKGPRAVCREKEGGERKIEPPFPRSSLSPRKINSMEKRGLEDQRKKEAGQTKRSQRVTTSAQTL